MRGLKMLYITTPIGLVKAILEKGEIMAVVLLMAWLVLAVLSPIFFVVLILGGGKFVSCG
ncbi:MAG: hypothetical protein AAB617_01220 [Patescibacteria group bacterium]